MRRFSPRAALLVHALALVSLVAGGCVDNVPSIALTDWELELDGARERVVLPTHLGHGLDKHAAIYVLRTRVPIEESWRGHDLTFGMPLFRGLMELHVDGRPVPYLDEHLLDSRRVMMAHRFRIDGLATARESIVLEIRVDSRISHSSWWDDAPRLALGPYGDRWTRIVNAWNHITAWFSFVALVTLSLVFWLLHLTAYFSHAHNTTADNKNTEFAKLAGGASLYPAIQLGLLQPTFGLRDLSFLLISTIITVKASVQLARKYVGLPLLPRWTAYAVGVLTIVLPLVAGGFIRSTWVVSVALSVVAIVAYLILETCRRAGTHARGELWWMIGSWSMVMVLSTSDVCTGLGMGTAFGGLQFACFGLLLFVGIQAYLLSRDHTRLLVSQLTLNRELGTRVAEVEVLNEELRRKVGDRSRELSAALRKMRVEGEGDGELRTGSVLGDHYRVVSRLGAGAMGAVYRVERLSDGRSLAAKVVRGRVRPDSLERFTREAELAARLDHPNVVRVYDVDVTSAGELFLVMELVEGRSLEDERSRFGERAFAVAVVSQIASALAAIHESGIVHRDLKPSNVLVASGSGTLIKVADFGIAGFGDTEQPKVSVGGSGGSGSDDANALDATIDAPPSAPSNPKLTQTGAIMGTPLYMAPEVLHGTATIGSAADLFSLGLIAYQLFGGPAIEREGTGFRRRTIGRFSEFASGLTPEIAGALQRCLSIDPTIRPSAKDLRDLLSGAAARVVG